MLCCFRFLDKCFKFSDIIYLISSTVIAHNPDHQILRGKQLNNDRVHWRNKVLETLKILHFDTGNDLTFLL